MNNQYEFEIGVNFRLAISFLHDLTNELEKQLREEITEKKAEALIKITKGLFFLSS